MIRIQSFILFVLLVAFSNHNAQVAKKQINIEKNILLQHQGNFRDALQKIIKVTSTEQTKYSDSLDNQISINQKKLCADFDSQYKMLYSVKSDLLSFPRRDTLKNSFTSLFQLIQEPKNTLKTISSGLINITSQQLDKQRKILIGKELHSVENYDDNKEAFREFADSLIWFMKDSCSNTYSTLLDKMNDQYFMVRDSLESICSSLIDNQQTENELIAEQKSASADSLAEVKADSINYYSGSISFYNSLSYGYDRNPLYYYSKLGDQIKQLFTQAVYQKKYLKSNLNIAYMGTLMLFNKIQERNYYEHSFNAQYRIDYFEGTAGKSSSTNFSEPDNFGNDKNNNLTFGLKLSARHDKEYYKDYNNKGAEFAALYKFRADSSFVYNIKNTLGYRNYILITELSNITDILEFELAKVTRGGFHYGLSFTAGIKYFTKSVYDSAIYIVTTPAGKIKSKQVSLKPQSNGSYQLTLGLFSSKTTDSFSFESRILYRYNINSENRILGMYVNTTFLSEDIYNESFAFQGPEGKIIVNWEMLFGIQFNATAEIQHKKMNLPALDLQGNQNSSNRIDLRSYAEFGFSKYYEICDGLSLDLSMMFSLLRNQSNDDYNDYSSYTTSISVGIGF